MVALTLRPAAATPSVPRPRGWSIALRGVGRVRAGRRILHDIDLDAAPGRIVAIVGPSGCGASSLLRIIAGTERCDAGAVLIEGRVGTAAPRLPTVGERVHATRGRRARASVIAAARRAGVAEPEAEADRLIALVGLSTHDYRADRPALGDRQRWAIARVLASRPRALLLDDALSGLHTPERAQTRDRLVRELRERGVTTLWATRDTSEAAAVADELVVLDRGRVVVRGCPDDVYARVADAAVVDLLGPVSLVPGIVEGDTVEVWGQRLSLVGAAHDGHCDVVVRPEDVRLVGATATGIDAVVAETVFLGRARRATVVTADGVRVTADHPVQLRLREGDRVRIALAPVPVVARSRE